MNDDTNTAEILADKREWLHVLRVDLARLEALPEFHGKAVRVDARCRHVATLEGMIVLLENAARVPCIATGGAS